MPKLKKTFFVRKKGATENTHLASINPAIQRQIVYQNKKPSYFSFHNPFDYGG